LIAAVTKFTYELVETAPVVNAAFALWPTAIADAWAFVLNPFHYDGPLPIELIPGARLARATPSQIKTIEALREKIGRAGESMAFRHEPILQEIRESADWDRILPPRSTFWVISFDIHPSEILKFRRASQLTDNELDLGGIFPPEQQIYLPLIEFPWTMESYFDSSWRNDAQRLNVKHLLIARNLADKIQLFRQEENDDPAKSLVLRVYDDFIELSEDHRIGHLRLLGHFALIEALITHDPADSGRRLSHQVRTKMPLLMRRFYQPLVVTDFFDLNSQEESWRLLYRVRSCFAHGENPDFDADAKSLRDLYSVFRFVREALKRLLTLALDEPQLVFDLKAC
jgi:hypothetical protein